MDYRIPLLEYSEEQGRFVAMHHPFTMPMEEDLDKLDTDPGAVRAKAYDITLNGNEIGGGASEFSRMMYSQKCLRCWALPKSRPRSASASC